MKHALIYIIFIVLAAAPCRAQWQPDSAFFTYQVAGFFPIDTNLFFSLADGSRNTLYLMLPNGTFSQRDESHYLNNVGAMGASGPYIFAAEGSIVRSTDLGEHWTVVSLLDTDSGPFTGGSMLAVNGNTIFAGGYRSTDTGARGTWSLVAGGFNFFTALMWVTPTTIIGGVLHGGIYYSTDAGSTWTQTSGASSNSFAVIGDTIFSAGAGLLNSTDFGKSWNETGLTYGGPASCVATDGKNLFVGTYDSGVVISTDRGNSWRTAHEGLYDLWISRMDPIWPTRADNINVNAICVSDSQVWVNFSVPKDNRWSTFHRPISEMVNSNQGVVERVPIGDSIEIYPNPTMDRVSILSGGTNILGVRVMNVLGEGVLSTEYRAPSSGELQLDFSKLPSGTYFIEIQTPKGTVLRKLVRE